MTADQDRAGEPVGSLADETSRLFEALSGWASDHPSSGAADCSLCPICRSLNVVRQVNPEALAHLKVAASSFAQAVSVLLQTPVPDESRTASRPQDRDGRP